MSSDSLAVFRRGMGPDMAALADKHMQHDLHESDREALQSAARTVSLHASLGSLLGLTLATLLAYRLRGNRRALFRSFKTAEKPTSVRFADGREEALPDLTPLLRPSRLGDLATYALLGFGGLFFGGEAGLLTGTFRARQEIGRDRERRDRVQDAFKRFRADVLRTQANALEQSTSGSGGWGW